MKIVDRHCVLDRTLDRLRSCNRLALGHDEEGQDVPGWRATAAEATRAPSPRYAIGSAVSARRKWEVSEFRITARAPTPL